MPSNTYPFIAREGWYLLVIVAVLAIFVYVYFGFAFIYPEIIIIFLFLFLLRDPPRTVPSIPLGLVSPIHGKVMSVMSIDDPWISRKATRIRMRMSLFDIYSLRSPIEGKLMKQWALSPCEEFPDRNFVFWIKTDEGDDVVMEIHLNMITAPIFRFYIHAGERVGQGQRCGFLYLGGLVDVWVPENCNINVESGSKILAGSDIIAKLIHNQGATAIQQSSI